MMMNKGIIEVEALSYVRGRTLPNTLFVIDEAQNITHHEAKALLTRMGENSKIVLIGDLEQIDDVCVIGAGSAGLVAATTANRLGAKTSLVESDIIGGGMPQFRMYPQQDIPAFGKSFL